MPDRLDRMLRIAERQERDVMGKHLRVIDAERTFRIAEKQRMIEKV